MARAYPRPSPDIKTKKPTMIRFLLMFALPALLLAFVLLYWFRRDLIRAERRAKDLLKQLDEKYADYVKRRLTLNFIEEEAPGKETENIKQEALRLLKPTLDALLSHIEAVQRKDVSIEHESAYFGNVTSLAAAYLARRRRDLLSAEVRAEFYDALATAIEADLADRVLDQKTGEKLAP
jgi:hypothetical protein